MKVLLFILIFLAKLGIVSNAQNLITVQNGTNVSFYTNINAAVSASNNGDTIYIPGGTWTFGNLAISKELHFIGVGHNPDSSQASLTSNVFGDIILFTGASNGCIKGIKLSGNISAQSNIETVTNYNISRNNILGSINLGSNCSNWIIYENILNQIIQTTSSTVKSINNGFYNNIICRNVRFFGSGNIFKNNVFLNWTHENQNRGIEYSIFENNIVFNSVSGQDVIPYGHFGNTIFNNNLFISNYTFPFQDNLFNNNIVNQSQSSIFVNQAGATFNYSHDYHLKASSPGKNAGTDGTDIGIYGGIFPWKDGSLPANPHIQSKQIASSTDQNGNLKINIKVKAQNN